MTILGFLIFLFSNVFVLSLVGFCFYRVLTLQQEHMHAPLGIDTKDLNQDDNGEEENK